ncbi:hypothetical protein LCGC14_2863600 [marine sediment metagenome]|uniref:Uncharacterized protein n=1 Tax=marine sediment metagenome TaxID=412755 RepID=A0A0F9AW48_9ZZZZ
MELRKKDAWKMVLDRVVNGTPNPGGRRYRFSGGLCHILKIMELDGHITESMHRTMLKPLNVLARQKGKGPASSSHIWPYNAQAPRVQFIKEQIT